MLTIAESKIMASPPTMSTVPDTGSLRGDVLELLRRSNLHGEESIALFVVTIGAHHLATGDTFAEIREEAVGARATSILDQVLDRAAARGAIDPERLTPRVRAVAFDLFRHDLLMTMRPLPDEDIVAIVDEVFLPLVSRR
ncbi:TetR-like C-terminal domain-containing protein [Rhodococcus sp. NPDC003318]|uniref:TetR-like C-terminal domain-containing protein n=1 Tax=Rhodococcus sp. NPDC003318 TaxID=3364503 RepID=UPI0036C72595